jgi:rubrerythrin
MTPTEALKLALEREEASIKLYQELIKEHPTLQGVLTSLLNEEFKHKKLIENEIFKATRY